MAGSIRLRLGEQVLKRWPALKVGVVTTSKHTGFSTFRISMETLANDIMRHLKSRFSSVEQLERHLHVKVWKHVYSSFGDSPKSVIPPPFLLCKGILEGQHVSIQEDLNTLKDLFECAYLLPVTIIDLNKVRGNLVLDMYKNGNILEGFPGNLGRVLDGEVVYSDSEGILTRFWNYAVSSRVQPSPASTCCTFLFEAPEFVITNEAFDSILAEMTRTLEEELGGIVKGAKVDAENREMTIPLSEYSRHQLSQ